VDAVGSGFAQAARIAASAASKDAELPLVEFAVVVAARAGALTDAGFTTGLP
jgi:hypothetical protein